MPQLDTLTEPNAFEEEEENQEDKFVVHNDSFAGPSYLHTPPSKDFIRIVTTLKWLA